MGVSTFNQLTPPPAWVGQGVGASASEPFDLFGKKEKPGIEPGFPYPPLTPP